LPEEDADKERGASSYGQHEQRAEVVIFRLAAYGRCFSTSQKLVDAAVYQSILVTA
jgi:hypothetical protein